MSVLNKVTHYQRKIERNKENFEGLIDCINKLDNLPVTVRHLEKTGIGKTINGLRKIGGEVGNVAKALVWKWKRMVIAEAVAEERAERRLRDPTVSSSDENFPSSERTEESEPTIIEEDTNSTLSSTTGNYDIPAVAGIQETCEAECTSSTASQNCNVLKYESGICDTLHPSNETEDNIQFPTESASHSLPLNQNSPKDRKEKDYSHHRHHKHYRHSSKHHSSNSNSSSSSSNRKDKPKEKKKDKRHGKSEAVRGESDTQERDFKVKIEKLDTDDDIEEEEERAESSGSSSKYKQLNKKDEYEPKTSEKKRRHKDREQKRKSDHSPGNSESTPKHSKSSEKAKKIKIMDADDDGIDCFSGASFAEALGMGDTRKKKKLNTSTTSAVGNSLSGGSPGSKMVNKPSTSTRDATLIKPELLLADVKLEPLDVEVDLASTLPEISPNYKPLPHPSSPVKLRKGRPLTEEAVALDQAVTQVILSKQQRQRTKVYSGVKTGGPIPTLYDLCVHILKENIDALEYTGGVPYDILKPILQQATPEQLFQLEHYNPYLIEDTDELWDFHCRKEFRAGQRLPMETAREMYLRCLDEREAKLKALTCNIQQSLAKSTPVRQTKLAYVDSVAKPPRNVARQQAKYGTGNIPKPIVGKSEKSSSVSKPSTSNSGATSGFSQRSTQSNARVKPRMAPLMQKTMKLAKSFKR